MLVLARKSGKSIVIRDDIIVTVLNVRGNKVRLGIEAPVEVTVHRKEVYEKLNGTIPVRLSGHCCSGK